MKRKEGARCVSRERFEESLFEAGWREEERKVEPVISAGVPHLMGVGYGPIIEVPRLKMSPVILQMETDNLPRSHRSQSNTVSI